MSQQPQWVTLFNELIQPITDLGLAALNNLPASAQDEDYHVNGIPYCAMLHLVDCLKTSMIANLNGRHSVAVCLIRQCVEALTLIDIGLQDEVFAYPLLKAWDSDKKKHGNLRQSLEKEIWSCYGSGLWNEPWSEFFGNLARAVQPYAHYTQKLMLWQVHVVESPPINIAATEREGFEFIAMLGPSTDDVDKSFQVTLMQALIVWALGRLLLENRSNEVVGYSKQINEFGKALGESTLLDEHSDWSIHLLPVMFPASGTTVSEGE